jgi:DNA polymerase elongation subunit (family B)
MREENLASYDIETGYDDEDDGIIPVLSYADDDENVYVSVCYPLSVDQQQKVVDCLYSSEWLMKHAHPRSDVNTIPPVKGKIYLQVCNNEKDMLHWIFFHMENTSNIHNVIAWYADFDKKGTLQRTFFNDLGDVWKYFNVIDIMPMYVRATGMQSYEGRSALHWSARNTLGYGKILRTEDGTIKTKKRPIPDLVKNDPVLLTVYNVWDSILPLRLNYHYKDLINQWKGYTDFCGLNITDWSDSSYLVEELIQMWVIPEGKILPSRGLNKYYHSIEGGYVKPPIIGLHMPCIELDITKTYPNVMISGNLSSETLVENPCMICDNYQFCIEKGKVHNFLKRREKSVDYIKQIASRKQTYPGVIYKDISEGKSRLPEDHDFIDPHTPAICPINEFTPICEVTIFPSGRIFRKDISSPVPNMLRELTQTRDKIRKKMKDVEKEKDLLRKAGNLTEEREKELDELYQIYYSDQFNKKIVMNSVYGQFVYSKFRLADSRIGADITDVARRQVHWNADVIENYHPTVRGVIGYNSDVPLKCQVVYSDTDSNKFVITNLDEINKSIEKPLEEDDFYKIAQHYADKVNSTYLDFSQQVLGQNTDSAFEVKVEEVMEAFYVWSAKKNYIYKKYGTEKPKKTGIGRSDKLLVFYELTDDMAKLILKNDMLGLSKYLSEFEEKVITGEYRVKLGRPKALRTWEDGPDGPIFASSLKGFWYSMEYSNSVFGKNFKPGDKPTFFTHVKSVKDFDLPKNGMIALEFGDDPADFGVKIDYEGVLRDDIIETRSLRNMLAPLGGWNKIKSGFLPPEKTLDELW